MKRRTAFLTGIAAFALVLAGCFSPYAGDNGDNGRITIALGGTDRALVNPYTELASMRHEITLQGPGGTIIRTVTGGGSLTVEAAPGNWTVKIRARGPKPAFYNDVETDNDFPKDPLGHILRALGETSVTVTAGTASAANITMISATEVSNWRQLATAVNYANKVVSAGGITYSAREEIIVLTQNMSFSTEGSSITLENGAGKKITLMADREVAVTRSINDGSFFVINDGTLTLGRPGMTGTITFDGGRGSSAAPDNRGASFVEVVADGGKPLLIMNGGVTLTNNFHVNSNSTTGQGGAVNVTGGSFTMNGGIISNNYAWFGIGGGAVYVNAGSFTMNGGTITDNFAMCGGGVYTSNGKCIMNGGIISGNTAIIGGGGVWIYRDENILPEAAYFIKKGGTIYGNNADPGDANIVEESPNGGTGIGAAVYYQYKEEGFYGDISYPIQYRNTTLNENDRLSTDPDDAGWANWEETPR